MYMLFIQGLEYYFQYIYNQINYYPSDSTELMISIGDTHIHVFEFEPMRVNWMHRRQCITKWLVRLTSTVISVLVHATYTQVII